MPIDTNINADRISVFFFIFDRFTFITIDHMMLKFNIRNMEEHHGTTVSKTIGTYVSAVSFFLKPLRC